MTFYPDFSKETMVTAGEYVRAIGWLDEHHGFQTGEIPAEFLYKLRDIIEKHLESESALGWDGIDKLFGVHTCELCHNFSHGSNIGIPDDGILYVAPAMILHYIEEHEYLPHKQFIDSVLESPIPGTEEYSDAVAIFFELHRQYQENLSREQYEEASRIANK